MLHIHWNTINIRKVPDSQHPRVQSPAQIRIRWLYDITLATQLSDNSEIDWRLRFALRGIRRNWIRTGVVESPLRHLLTPAVTWSFRDALLSATLRDGCIRVHNPACSVAGTKTSFDTNIAAPKWHRLLTKLRFMRQGAASWGSPVTNDFVASPCALLLLPDCRSSVLAGCLLM